MLLKKEKKKKCLYFVLKNKRLNGKTPSTRPRSLSRFSGCGQGLLRLREAEPTVTHPCAAWHCGELGSAREVVGGEVGAVVCFLVVSNSRALFPSPRRPAGRRNGGGGGSNSSGCSIGYSSFLSREPVPLPPPSHCLLCV